MSSKNRNDKLAAKRASVTGKSGGGNGKFIGIAVVLLAVSGGIFLVSNSNGTPTKGVTPQVAQEVKQVEADRVTYDAALFDDGEARWFKYTTSDGLDIRYFVVKSTDGIIRAAFDACDSCWRSGKGYHQEGDEVVCGNCRMRFPTDKINVVKGGCNPSPLKRSMENGKVVIKVSDIEAGSGYFDLRGKGG